MKISIRSLILFSMLTAIVGCATPPRLTQSELEAAVLSWLDCDECYNGQFDYVTSLGPQVKPTLEDAAEHREPFASRLENRRDKYLVRSTVIVARQMGIDLMTANPDQLAAVGSRADELAELYIQGDKRRHTARAKRALANLSRRQPEGSGGEIP